MTHIRRIAYESCSSLFGWKLQSDEIRVDHFCVFGSAARQHCTTGQCCERIYIDGYDFNFGATTGDDRSKPTASAPGVDKPRWTPHQGPFNHCLDRWPRRVDCTSTAPLRWRSKV